MRRTCKHCGKELPPKKKNGPPARYCNAVCKARYWDSRNLPVDKPNGYHCYICGQELIGKRIKQCASCYADAAERKQQKKQERLAKVCKHCGGALPTQGPGRPRKFCSDECQRTWWVANRDQGKVYTFTCQNCGKEYETNYSNRNSFCSQECVWEHNSKRALLNKRCLVCKTVFEGTVSNSDYCSDACRNRAYSNTCVQCGKEFRSKHPRTLCSRQCQLERGREKYNEYMLDKKGEQHVSCRECGSDFIVRYGDKRKRFCSSECSRRHNGRIHKRSRRALKKSNGPVERINPLAVYERDCWRCGICGKKVNPDLQFPHPKSASLDHILPLSKGGTHTWQNVQLAHLRCNVVKCDSGGGQLRLGITHDRG